MRRCVVRKLLLPPLRDGVFVIIKPSFRIQTAAEIASSCVVAHNAAVVAENGEMHLNTLLRFL
jgi:hypothetical protein